MTPGPAVIDTNVVVSALLTADSDSPTARILDGMLADRFRFLISAELLAEYREVLLRPAIRRRHRLSEGEVDVLLTDIAAAGTFLDIEAPPVGRGREDDSHLRRILAADLSAVLVTGDLKLIVALGTGARVLTARTFSERLTERGRPQT
jgi:putative PIN family toxin of toxin-antitoxin system